MKNTGVWTPEEARYEHKFSEGLAKIISNNFEGLIYDVGCGNGAYVDFLNKNEKIKCIGIDGTDLGNGNIVHDLTTPINFSEKGTVICLEVAEHIPKQFESILIDNIDGMCSKYLLISWAVVGQGGYGHVNEQDRDYVLRTFNSRGYRLLNKETETIKEALFNDPCWWFRESIYLFTK
jgi:hypothetical protein